MTRMGQRKDVRYDYYLSSNIWNPYVSDLLRALESANHSVGASFRRSPAAEGREWIPDLQFERRRAFQRGDIGLNIRSGSYVGFVEAARSVGGALGAQRQVWWGERFRSSSAARSSYRRLFVRLGHDAVLAVGSIAAMQYADLVPGDVPVHTFPYVRSSQHRAAPTPPRQVVGFVGSLIDRKGCDLAIDTVGLVDSASRPLLEIVGSGAEAQRLRQHAQSLGVEVRLLGWMAPARVSHVRRRWIAQLVPSRYDGWGVVVQEALADGVPVIASNKTGAAVDLLRSGHTGVCLDLDVFAEAACVELAKVDDAEHRRRAALFADCLSAEAAASWLAGLDESDVRSGPARSFIDHAWAEYRHRIGES